MATKLDPEKIYKELKNNKRIYQEEIHCPMVIRVISERGTVSSFCKEAMIADTYFYQWVNKYPIFEQCYRYAAMCAKEAWEEEGRIGKDDPEFNLEYWRIVGASRYGLGKTNRVRVEVDAETTPYHQYQQLLKQASNGDFTAAEVKQLMESINVGTRVYETFQLQKEVDQMKEDLMKMSQNANNIVPIEKAKKAN